MILRLTILLLIVGCDSSLLNKDDDVHPLVGEWDMIEKNFIFSTSATDTNLTNSVITIISNENCYETDKYYQDGTFNYSGLCDSESFSNNGYWSTNENKLTISIPDGLPNDTTIADYLISSDTLTLNFYNISMGNSTIMNGVVYYKKNTN